MSDKEHLSLYKSKSGNHLLPVSHRERIQEEKKKIRNKDRHAAYTAHRVIEKTPQKQLPITSNASPAPTKAAEPEQPNNVSVTVKNKSLLDRKKAFIERFQRFRDKKTKALSEKKNPIPFVSAVPSGRYVTVKPAPVIKAPKAAPKKIEPKNVVGVSSNMKTPTSSKSRNVRYSPINTRSKKFKLLSPSQLPTPTRKKRKSSIVRDANGVKTIVKRIISSTTASGRSGATVNRVLTTKVTSVPKPTVRKVVPAPMIQKIKPKIPSVKATVQVKKPATIIKEAPASKPFKITEVPPIPSTFDFTTSTAVKPRKSVNVKIRSRQNSVQLFNESISPIDTTTPKTSKKLSSAAKLSSVAKRTPAIVEEVEKEANHLNMTPVKTEAVVNTSVNYVSPFVTIARGKHHASKEREARETKYQLPSRKSIELNESTEERQNKEAAIYFRMQIKNETDRLLAIVDKWSAVKVAGGDTIPDEYIDQIDVAIGQTRLLISNKFEQFRGLVDKCEAAVALHPVRPEDLEGFWGMVYMQVENCNARFDRLEGLKANDWQDPEIKVTKTKKIKVNGAIGKTNKAKMSRPNSVLAKMLMEARKKMKETKENHESKVVAADRSSIFSLSRRKSLLNDSVARKTGTPQKSGTPRKSLWVVSIQCTIKIDCGTFHLILLLFFVPQVEEQADMKPVAATPQRGILKTPGSVRKPRNTLVLNIHPEVRLFNAEKEFNADLSGN